ncbi:hypothetical protein DsansV1_C29g0210921 [Dioscorea sansibarensis]
MGKEVVSLRHTSALSAIVRDFECHFTITSSLMGLVISNTVFHPQEYRGMFQI